MNQPSPSQDTFSFAADPPRVAVIASAWHRDVVAKATQSIADEFRRCRVGPEAIDQFEVPGAFEIPLYARRLARTGRYEAIVACALVVNGGIYRHEFVAQAVIDGLMRVQMEEDLPVISCVLTPRDFHEHDDHRKFFSQHFVKKGSEAAIACLQTIASLRSLAAEELV